jgi:AraC-like DNA-binding protein
MEYREFVSDLPPGPTLTFTSAEEVEEAFLSSGVDQRTRQLAGGKFRAHLAARRIGKIDLVADRYSAACTMRLAVSPGMFGLLFPRGPNGGFTACGRSVSEGHLLVMPDRSEVDIVTSGLAGSDDIGIPEERFFEMAEAMCPTFHPPKEPTVVAGNPAELRTLRRGILGLLRPPERRLDPERLSNLIAEAVAWIDRSLSGAKPANLRVRRARARVAKQAREFIEENYRDPVRLEGLCRVTAVPARTLQRCFRDYFDLAITDYLKTVRLNAAHRDLAAAHPSRMTVTNIAMRHGCTHLGRFSVEYRKRFGESPRETLAMRAGGRS